MIEKWKVNNYLNFFELERTNCYWFWYKGKITIIKNRDTGEIYEQNLSGKCEWNGIRLQNGFNNCLNVLTENYMREGKYNGQTKSEFEKNKVRVSDIWNKSGGDVDKAIALAKTQANRITDEWKALNRAFAAKEMGYEEIFEVFFHRAYELGSVSKGEYREYKLDKLGI